MYEKVLQSGARKCHFVTEKGFCADAHGKAVYWDFRGECVAGRYFLPLGSHYELTVCSLMAKIGKTTMLLYFVTISLTESGNGSEESSPRISMKESWLLYGKSPASKPSP